MSPSLLSHYYPALPKPYYLLSERLSLQQTNQVQRSQTRHEVKAFHGLNEYM